MKPITVYTHGSTPNPLKVLLLLEELKVPYTTEDVNISTQVKEKPYTDINPNGRLPSIQDPNTGITVWESGAIMEYLVEKYDKDGRLSPVGEKNKWLAKSLLYFQMSGQGPYFGQKAWFSRFHSEKLPSAIERYLKEMHRVFGVQEELLRRNGTGWMVGDRISYIDLAFLPWNTKVIHSLDDHERFDMEEKYPLVHKWTNAMITRPSLKGQMAKLDASRFNLKPGQAVPSA